MSKLNNKAHNRNREDLIKAQENVLLSIIKNSRSTPCNDTPEALAEHLGADLDAVREYLKIREEWGNS